MLVAFLAQELPIASKGAMAKIVKPRIFLRRIIDALRTEWACSGREGSHTLSLPSAYHDEEHFEPLPRPQGMGLASRHDDHLSCMHAVRFPGDGDLSFAF